MSTTSKSNVGSSPLLARQSPTVLGKIAFWSFLVIGVFGLAGVIALTIATGAPSRDLAIAAACTLVAAILLLTHLRWAPIVTTLVGAYLLVVSFIEPFAIEALANPKGPNGGIYHFIGNVLISALAILAFGGSLGEALRNYRGGGRAAPPWLPAALSGVAGMVVGAIF